MGVFDVPYCPNLECLQGKMKKGEKCPLCGAWAQEFGVGAAGDLLVEKKRRQRTFKEEPEGKEILTSDKMTDEEITAGIHEDMMNLKRHEAGTGIDGFLTILSGTAMERISASLLKAIVDQNKIMIKQNELILRSLKKLLEKPAPS